MPDLVRVLLILQLQWTLFVAWPQANGLDEKKLEKHATEEYVVVQGSESSFTIEKVNEEKGSVAGDWVDAAQEGIDDDDEEEEEEEEDEDEGDEEEGWEADDDETSQDRGRGRKDPKWWADWYNPYFCPDAPPMGYPQQWPAQQVMGEWNPNVTDDIPVIIYQGLCVFDITTSYATALKYLEADQPFVVRNDPAILDAVHKWQDDQHIASLLGHDTSYPMHKSANQNSPFQLWRRVDHPPPGWSAPTNVVRVNYTEYQRQRRRHQNNNKNKSLNKTHIYLHTEGYWSFRRKKHNDQQWPVFHDLPMFLPNNFDLYQEIFHQGWQKLTCQFGMTGNIAGFYFNMQRSTIVLLKGQQRFLLADPTQCPDFHFFPVGHPSPRYSSLSWTEMITNNKRMQPLFLNEVVLQAGDVLILPSYWIQSAVNLATAQTAQCSAYSQGTMKYKKMIQRCGNLIPPS